MSDEYEALREALRAGPTQLRWVMNRPTGCTVDIELESGSWAAAYAGTNANAKLVAAANPTTIRRLLSERDALRKALEALEDMYVHAWDSADGGLVMLGHSIPKFEEAHRQARIALGCQLFGDLPGDIVDAAIASTPAAGE